MKENIKLDKWDSKIINIFKRSTSENPQTVKRFEDVWIERCALPDDYPNTLHFIIQHFLKLAQDLDLLDNEYTFKEFIFNLEAKHNWKFTCMSNQYLTKDTTDYHLILLSRLGSLFANTEVVSLPGYICEE